MRIYLLCWEFLEGKVDEFSDMAFLARVLVQADTTFGVWIEFSLTTSVYFLRLEKFIPLCVGFGGF